MTTDQVFEGLDTLPEGQFVDCTFRSCRFEGEVASSSCRGCAFVDCTFLNVHSRFSILSQCSFESCNLIGMVWHEWKEAGRGLGLFSGVFSCFFKYNRFAGLDLRKTDFSSNSFSGCDFDQCNLFGVSFLGCGMEETAFAKCNLEKADFRDTSGWNIDLFSNRLKGARFSFPEAMGLLAALQIKID